MQDRRGQESNRNGVVYAKALEDMPDYSTFITREIEKKLGPFVYDPESLKIKEIEIISKGPFELDNAAIYKG